MINNKRGGWLVVAPAAGCRCCDLLPAAARSWAFTGIFFQRAEISSSAAGQRRFFVGCAN